MYALVNILRDNMCYNVHVDTLEHISDSGVEYLLTMVCYYICNEYGWLSCVVTNVLCNQIWWNRFKTLLPMRINLMGKDDDM